MGDLYSSSIDPLFWLHHAQLDQLWATWQAGADARLKDISGPTKVCTKIGETTLDTTMYIGYNGPARPISAVMDTQNRDGSGILCYKYV